MCATLVEFCEGTARRAREEEEEEEEEECFRTLCRGPKSSCGGLRAERANNTKLFHPRPELRGKRHPPRS
eukprot:15465779-Alexandrium_andersonii.AAC.1